MVIIGKCYKRLIISVKCIIHYSKLLTRMNVTAGVCWMEAVSLLRWMVMAKRKWFFPTNGKPQVLILPGKLPLSTAHLSAPGMFYLCPFSLSPSVSSESRMYSLSVSARWNKHPHLKTTAICTNWLKSCVLGKLNQCIYSSCHPQSGKKMILDRTRLSKKVHAYFVIKTWRI